MSRCVVYQSGGFTNYGISYRKYSQEELAEMGNRAVTENEKAINILEHMKNLVTVRIFEEEALDRAIKALEEVQQYRVLGTIEELTAKNEELKRWHTDRIAENIKNSFANTSTLCCHNCDHKDEYIEELEAEVEEYQAIGTPEECRAAVEKQTAISREIIEGKYFCPKCHNLMPYPGYCGCGQKLY